MNLVLKDIPLLPNGQGSGFRSRRSRFESWEGSHPREGAMYVRVAQWIEHQITNLTVEGSTPSADATSL